MKKLIILFIVASVMLVSSCSNPEPLSAEAEKALYGEFKKLENQENKLEIFENLKESNPKSRYLGVMLARISFSYIEKGEYDKASNYLEQNSDATTSGIYNELAWKIYEKDLDLDKADNFALKGIDLARKDLESPKNKKPDSITEEEWKESKKSSLAFILDTYGCIQKKLSNLDLAEKSFEEAVELTNNEHPELNENYITTLVEQGNFTKAQSLLEKNISNGIDSKNMKSMLNDVFIKLGNNENDFGKYLSKFEQTAKQKMISKLKSEIKSEPAPQFSLIDLDGKSVSLSDFKGKIVVVDFWATWCGPCLKSMPIMKNAIAKFSDVQFLFVNTWERVEDKKKNAVDFISKNNYPFLVLMDDKNEIVSEYKVQGIPTKFIIDKNQNIRFESVGFSGKESEFMEELELMFSAIE